MMMKNKSPYAMSHTQQVSVARLEEIAHELLLAIGEDPERQGLKETPRRFASWWKEFIEYDAGNMDALFEHVTTDQMVIVSGIRVWSLCEHHLLPFSCDVSIGYVTAEKVLGLSKFARITHKHAHKLQVQERLTDEIADEVQELIQTTNIAVITRGEHLCMSIRGIRTKGEFICSVMRGIFRDQSETRAEFLQMVNHNIWR